MAQKKSRLKEMTYSIPVGPQGSALKLPPLYFQTVTVKLPNDFVSGVSFRGYKTNIANGKSATTPLSAKFSDFKFKPAGYRVDGTYIGTRPDRPDGYYKTNEIRYFGYRGPEARDVLSYPSNEAGRAASAAVIKFSEKVRERIQTVSGPTALGEIRETLEMVRKPGAAIMKLHNKYMKRVKRRLKKNPRPHNHNRRQLERWHKWHVDAYLSFTFGIKPFLADVEGGIDALAELTKVPQLAVRAQAKGKPFSDSTSTWQQPYQIHRRRTAECSVQIVGAIRSDIFTPRGSLSRFKQLMGFNWDDAVPTIWNLIPFSFVVDYFTNINGILSASYASSSYVAWSSTSTRIKCTVKNVVQCRFVYATPSPGYDMYQYNTRTRNTDGEGLYTETTINRTDVLPQVRLYFDAPKPKQLFNIAALTSSILKLQSIYRG